MVLYIKPHVMMTIVWYIIRQKSKSNKYLNYLWGLDALIAPRIFILIINVQPI